MGITRLLLLTVSLLLLLPLLLLAAGYIINTDWEVEHRIEIDATPAAIWSILSDLDNYSSWNRYSPNVRGKFAVGEVVWVEAHLDDKVQLVQNYIVSIKPEQELCWQSADWFGVLASGLRCRSLTPLDNGKTLLVHHEIMSGPLAWLIEWQYRERIERGLALVDESLAQRAEQEQ